MVADWWESLSDELRTGVRSKWESRELDLREITNQLIDQGVDVNYDQMRRVKSKERWQLSPLPKKSVEIDLEAHQKDKQLQELRRKYQEALKLINIQEQLYAVMERHVTALPPGKILVPKRVRHAKASELVAVAPLADPHFGEVVTLAETGGLAEYNLTIGNRRLDEWVNRILQLTEIRREADKIRKIVLPLLGDTGSGDIHLDLAKTNVDNAMSIAVTAAYIIAQALMKLAGHYQEVEVPAIPGNHGRLVQKVEYKSYTKMNWDYLIYQLVAMLCKRQKNIKFYISQAFWMIHEIVPGWRALMWHGGNLQSYLGIPYYSAEKSVQRLREVLGASGQYFEDVYLAHFHQEVQIGRVKGSVFMSGSLKGGDEYVLHKMSSLAPPTQMLLFYHKDNGCVSKETLYLKEADDNPKLGFNLGVPGLWADAMDSTDN